MRSRSAVWALNALLLFSVVLLVLIVATSVIVVRFPRSARRTVSTITFNHPEVAVAASEAGEVARSVMERAAEGFEYRAAGPWLRLTGRPSADSPSPSSTPPSAVRESDCLSCHPGYFEQLRFGDVYFSHGAHKCVRGGCAACHAGSGPHRCASSEMDACGDCHALSGADAECDACHAPGTVFHGAELAADRGKADNCNVCHPSKSLEPTPRPHTIAASSAMLDSCEGCHRSGFCAECHPASHPPGYAQGHRQDMAARVTTPARCWNCHDAGWCALACHSGELSVGKGAG